jgi:hypothetical protein
MVGRPRQNSSVIHAHQTDILGSHNIQGRLAKRQSTQDIAVEILVAQQPPHATGSHSRLRQQA